MSDLNMDLELTKKDVKQMKSMSAEEENLFEASRRKDNVNTRLREIPGEILIIDAEIKEALAEGKSTSELNSRKQNLGS